MSWWNPMSWLKALSALSAFIEAVKLLSEYIKKKLREQKAEDAKREVDKAVETGDQRPLEKELGHEQPGRPTQTPLPDLKTRPVRDRSRTDL